MYTFWQGYYDFYEGYTYNQNPYLRDMMAYKEWQWGWMYGFQQFEKSQLGK